MGNTYGSIYNKLNPNHHYRKTSLEKITKFFSDNNNFSEKCVRIHINIKDIDSVDDLCKYIRNHGYICEYYSSWSADTGYTGVMEVSCKYDDIVKKGSFVKDKDCCCCFLPLDDKIHKFKCKHYCHRRCKKFINKCPICEFNYLKRKSLILETNYRK